MRLIILVLPALALADSARRAHPTRLLPESAQQSAQGTAQSPVPITEWTVPWEKTRPRDPYVDGQGRVWFVGQTGNYVARLDPASGQFKRYAIEEGTFPHNLIVDAAGNVWYAGNRNGRIGRIDGKTEKITTFMMPDAAVKDPHTLVFDGKGDIWFTAQQSNAVGHLETKTGKIRLAKVSTEQSRPYGIVVNSQDRPWFVEFGSNKVATIDPATMAITEYTLPSDKTHPRRLVATSDGVIWYADYTRGMLGKFDPRTRATSEWLLPAGAASLPYGMAVDDRDRIWLAETGVQPNRLVGFDSKTSTWISVTPISQSGGGTVRHMMFHRPTRTIWFGTDANTIARAKVP